MLATDDPFERAEQYQAQRGEWVVGGLETQVFWPNRAQLITFEGLEFLLQPAISEGQHRSLPAIALRVNGQDMTVNEGRAAVMRLATAIAWREGAKVEIVMWGGGSHPHRVGMLRNNAFTEFFSEETSTPLKAMKPARQWPTSVKGYRSAIPFTLFSDSTKRLLAPCLLAEIEGHGSSRPSRY